MTLGSLRRYESAPRRRLRTLRRIGEAAMSPVSWRGASTVAAFWWDGHPNFGDDLTPWLLPRYGFIPILKSPREALLCGVGSLIEFLPEDYAGAVWGSGLMTETRRSLPEARLLAVRGPLTRELLGASTPLAYGDPGLLVARHLPRPRVDRRLGVVPHGHHRRHRGLAAFAASGGPSVRVVDVHQRAQHAVRRIAASEAVLTTSLHGLITADSYGIPAVWTTLDPPLGGGAFKFHDYEAVVTPGRTRYVEWSDDLTVDEVVRSAVQVDADTVSAASEGLERALASLPEVIGPLPRFPRGMKRLLLG